MEPWEFPANICSKNPSACTHPHPKWMTGFWALIYINRTVYSQKNELIGLTAKDDISSQLATAYITNDHKQQSGACNVDGDETVLERSMMDWTAKENLQFPFKVHFRSDMFEISVFLAATELSSCNLKSTVTFIFNHDCIFQLHFIMHLIRLELKWKTNAKDRQSRLYTHCYSCFLWITDARCCVINTF